MTSALGFFNFLNRINALIHLVHALSLSLSLTHTHTLTHTHLCLVQVVLITISPIPAPLSLVVSLEQSTVPSKQLLTFLHLSVSPQEHAM